VPALGKTSKGFAEFSAIRAEPCGEWAEPCRASAVIGGTSAEPGGIPADPRRHRGELGGTLARMFAKSPHCQRRPRRVFGTVERRCGSSSAHQVLQFEDLIETLSLQLADKLSQPLFGEPKRL